ncbi:MAG: 5-carboxymethyl-2-hydroxymuconate isomerase [Pseudomonadota bacterium]
MPHVIIEYSDNLSSVIDIDALVGAMHEAALALDALPTGGIRTRAVGRQYHRVADSDPGNGFIYVTLRIGEGRSADVQKFVGEALFAALNSHVANVFDSQALSLGLEIQQINPETRWKRSNIRDYMERRQDKDCGKS